MEGPRCRNRQKGSAWCKHNEWVCTIGQEGTKNPAKWKSELIQPAKIGRLEIKKPSKRYCREGFKFELLGFLIYSRDFRAQGIESLVDVLVAAVDLFDIIDDGGSCGRHSRDQ